MPYPVNPPPDGFFLEDSSGVLLLENGGQLSRDTPVTIDLPRDLGTVNTTTPTLFFAGYSGTSGSTVNYRIQIDTVNTFDSVNLIDRESYVAGSWFGDTMTGFSTGGLEQEDGTYLLLEDGTSRLWTEIPQFPSGNYASYTVQPANALTGGTTYYWRIAIDITPYAGVYGAWGDTASFTVITGSDGSSTQPATARIANTYADTQTAIARISKSFTSTIAGTAQVVTTIDKLTDTFDSYSGTAATYGGKWTYTGTLSTRVTATSGQMVFQSQTAAQASALVSGEFIMSTGTVSVQVVSAGTQSIASHETIFYLDEDIAGAEDANNKVYLTIKGGTVAVRKVVAGVDTPVSSAITYDATDHKWFRFRELAGTTYVDASPDSRTWTQLWNFANAIDMTMVHVGLSERTTAAEASTTTSVFDNLNAFVLVKTQTATASITTDTYTKTQPATARVQRPYTKTQPATARITLGRYTYGSVNTLPTDASDMATLFSPADELSVRDDDGAYFYLVGPNTYNVVLFKCHNPNANSTDHMILTYRARSTVPTSTRTAYLQIFNYADSAWETLATDTATAANTTFTLSAIQLADSPDYYTTGDWIAVRVYQ